MGSGEGLVIRSRPSHHLGSVVAPFLLHQGIDLGFHCANTDQETDSD